MSEVDFKLGVAKRFAEEARSTAGSAGQGPLQHLAVSQTALIDALIEMRKENPGLTDREKQIINTATGIAGGEGWFSWDDDKGEEPTESEIIELERKLGI